MEGSRRAGHHVYHVVRPPISCTLLLRVLRCVILSHALQQGLVERMNINLSTFS